MKRRIGVVRKSTAGVLTTSSSIEPGFNQGTGFNCEPVRDCCQQIPQVTESASVGANEDCPRQSHAGRTRTSSCPSFAAP